MVAGEQLSFYAGPPTGFVERVALVPRGSGLGPGQASAFRFQRWIGSWATRRRRGLEVTVLVRRDWLEAIAVGLDEP